MEASGITSHLKTQKAQKMLDFKKYIQKEQIIIFLG